jgi:hypothetical protein
MVTHGNNPTPACNQLNAFLNQVNAKQTNEQLTASCKFKPTSKGNTAGHWM